MNCNRRPSSEVRWHSYLSYFLARQTWYLPTEIQILPVNRWLSWFDIDSFKLLQYSVNFQNTMVQQYEVHVCIWPFCTTCCMLQQGIQTCAASCNTYCSLQFSTNLYLYSRAELKTAKAQDTAEVRWLSLNLNSGQNCESYGWTLTVVEPLYLQVKLSLTLVILMRCCVLGRGL